MHPLFIRQIRKFIYLFKKNLDILVGYQIFTIFNLPQILVFPDIHHLFINKISAILDIKNSKIRLLIMLGVRLFFWAKNLQKCNILF